LTVAEEGGRGFAGWGDTPFAAMGVRATLTGFGTPMRMGLFFLSGFNGKVRMTLVTCPGIESISIWPPK
jgi:hypothetical protein